MTKKTPKKKIRKIYSQSYQRRQYTALLRKRRSAWKKGQATKFRKRIGGGGCVMIFDELAYVFAIGRYTRQGHAVGEKLKLFDDKIYTIKILVWLGIRYDVRQPAKVLTGNGIDTDLTELTFQSSVTIDEFWANYYAAARVFIEEQAPKHDANYERADFQLREIQVC
jgi:hypothetical protein